MGPSSKGEFSLEIRLFVLELELNGDVGWCYALASHRMCTQKKKKKKPKKQVEVIGFKSDTSKNFCIFKPVK